MPEPLNIVFAGTPDFAAASLQALLDSPHRVIAVYTQPDRPAGRGRKLTPSPVKTLALEHGIEVRQPQSLKDPEAQAELAALEPDLMVVVAYGLLLPKAVLEIPRLGCINVHASLLPRWRGAAPIHRAVLAGDAETGVTIMQMDEGLDTGDMLLKARCDIGAQESSGELHDRLAVIGAAALSDSLEGIAAGTIRREPQDDSLATYAHKLEKQEGELDWRQPAKALAQQVRGLSPWPVAFTRLGGDNLRVWGATALDGTCDDPPGTIVAADRDGIQVACGEGVLSLTRVQLPGGKALDAAAMLNARRDTFAIGTRLGGA
ncbi:methionyl-tRNA formyltransferase [Marinobacterium nitratireducens]|uniref:Methionyl-tRNA formyltransferase n=1 Tax=Marinobacterium nitratireducens TaxID=518897 RepID=A0A918DNY2_9GAMM|nr:methionyl-tRNA formyltransferase [Marinobacterium nitratireducens]GGO77435.1 methionyl-tRNA formyltransferase [Marinobacterium nitratireducens]